MNNGDEDNNLNSRNPGWDGLPPGRDPRCNDDDDDDEADDDDDDEEDDEEGDVEKEDENRGPKSLREELQIEDLSRCIFFKDSKIFAAAGPGLPLLQVNTDGTFVSLDPELPYRGEVDEDLVLHSDEHGRLLDALGQLRKLVGMKYKGNPLYFVTERHPENNQNLAAWFDENWKPHHLYLGETILSAAMVLRIRNRMLDGELSAFGEISSD